MALYSAIACSGGTEPSVPTCKSNDFGASPATTSLVVNVTEYVCQSTDASSADTGTPSGNSSFSLWSGSRQLPASHALPNEPLTTASETISGRPAASTTGFPSRSMTPFPGMPSASDLNSKMKWTREGRAIISATDLAGSARLPTNEPHPTTSNTTIAP